MDLLDKNPKDSFLPPCHGNHVLLIPFSIPTMDEAISKPFGRNKYLSPKKKKNKRCRVLPISENEI